MAGALQFELYDRANNSLGDISSLCLTKQVTRRLNRPWSARASVPTELVPDLNPGLTCLKVRLNGNIYFNGLVWFLEDSGNENDIYTDFLAIDPSVWWKFRAARDADGDLSLPTFLTDFIEGPAIVQNVLINSIEALNASGFPDGPLGVDPYTGTFETGGPNLSGAPVDWPMMISDIFTLLTDTGAVDIVVDPVDDNDGYSADTMAVVSAYNMYGSDLSGSVSFDYQTGQNNVKSFHQTIDMSTFCNALIYYFAPKVSIQRYRGSITPTDGFLPNSLQDEILASQDAYGLFREYRVYDTSPDWNIRKIRKLYREIWMMEAKLRLGPRRLVTMQPVRGVAPNFNIGDIVEINCGTKVRGGFTDAQQRIYEFTLTEDKDGPLEIGQLITSADAETSA